MGCRAWGDARRPLFRWLGDSGESGLTSEIREEALPLESEGRSPERAVSLPTMRYVTNLNTLVEYPFWRFTPYIDTENLQYYW